MNKPLRISITNVLQILALGIGLWFLFIIKDVLIIIFVAWVASTIMQPIVDSLQVHKVPRSLTAAVLVLAVVGFLILFVVASIPLFTAQINSLVNNGPAILDNFLETFKIRPIIDNSNGLEQQLPKLLLDQVSLATGSAISIARVVADSIFAILVTSFLTFYFLSDKDVIKNLILYFSPNKKIVEVLYSRIETRLRVWMLGQGIVMILIGVFTYTGLMILHVDYALPLAVFAGFLEIVPFVGPTLSVVPAVLIALAESPVKAISVVFMYFIIQQLEASIVVPRVMNKTVGLNPIIVILAVMVGSRILGPAGALLAIPLAAIFSIGFGEWQIYRSKKKVQVEDAKPSIT